MLMFISRVHNVLFVIMCMAFLAVTCMYSKFNHYFIDFLRNSLNVMKSFVYSY